MKFLNKLFSYQDNAVIDLFLPQPWETIFQSKWDLLQNTNIATYLQIASAQQHFFSHNITSSIASISSPELELLQNQQWIQKTSKTDCNMIWFCFSNEQLQKIIYEPLSVDEKETIHTKIAQAWEKLDSSNIEVIFYHYNLTSNKEKQLEYLILLFESEVNKNNIEEAKLLAEKALWLCDESTEDIISIKLYIFLANNSLDEEIKYSYYQKILQYPNYEHYFSFVQKSSILEIHLGYLDEAEVHLQSIVENENLSSEMRLQSLFPLLYLLLTKGTSLKKVDSLMQYGISHLPYESNARWRSLLYCIKGYYKEKEGILGQAQEFYERALQELPAECGIDLVQITLLLGHLYEQKGDFLQAKKYFLESKQVALQLNENIHSFCSDINLLSIQIQQHQLHNIENTLQDLLTQYTSATYQSKTLQLYGDFYNNQTRYEQAIIKYKEALLLEKNDMQRMRIHEKLAFAYKQHQKNEEAEKHFQALSDFYEKQSQDLLHAKYEWLKGNFSEKDIFYMNSLSILKNSGAVFMEGKVYESLALLYFNRNKNKDAKIYIKKALSCIKRQNMVALYIENCIYQGKFYQQQGKFHFALESYELAEKLNLTQENNAQKIQILIDKSQVYRKLDQFDKAIQLLQNALEISSNNLILFIPVCLELVHAYIDKNDFVNAFQWLQNAQRRNLPKHIQKTLILELGKFYFDCHEYEQSKKILQQFLQHTPEKTRPRSFALYVIGKIYLQEHHPLFAMECFSECLVIQESYDHLEGIARVYYQLGETYIQFNRTEQALECLQKSMNIWQELQNIPMLAQSYLNLASLYEREGTKDLAIKHYQEALQLYKTMDLLMAHSIEDKIESLE